MREWQLRWRALVPQLPAQLWLLAIAAFVNFLGFMVTPFLVIYLTQVAAFPVEVAGVLLTCFGIGGILGAWTGGRLSDRIGPSNVLVLGFLVSAGAMSIIPQLSDVVLIGGTFWHALLGLFGPLMTHLSLICVRRTSDPALTGFTMSRLTLEQGSLTLRAAASRWHVGDPM